MGAFSSDPSLPVLVTGAGGYVGGRLVPLLLSRGVSVRAAGRDAAKLACRPWGRHPGIQLVQADLADRESLVAALRGCRAVYYLVHSMNPLAGDFAAADRRLAENMAQACDVAGVARIIYLSGLGDLQDPALSHHLRSRAEVGAVLASSAAAVTILRAAMILGSGSASFEILRYLTERLPVMLTPSWVRTRCQPIAISNVLEYLAGCLEHPETAGQTYDIGGPDIVSYAELFQLYAKAAGLRRRVLVPLPSLSPWLSSHWLALVTPVPASLAKPLVLGLRNEVVCRDQRIRDIVPQRLLSCAEAIGLALDKVRQHAVETCWHDAGALPVPEWIACGDAAYAGGDVLEDGFRALLDGAPEDVWPALERIGGDTGWYFGNLLWRLRGMVDKLVGGPGLRRGRRHPTQLRLGDAVDWWRVVRLEPPQVLILEAEMRLPGQALLQMRLQPQGPDRCELSMVLRFLPRGLAGLAYWWAVYPLHQLVFTGMFRQLAKATGRRLLRGPEHYRPSRQDVCPMRPPSA